VARFCDSKKSDAFDCPLELFVRYFQHLIAVKTDKASIINQNIPHPA
jgi:hypothetical protein